MLNSRKMIRRAALLICLTGAGYGLVGTAFAGETAEPTATKPTTPAAAAAAKKKPLAKKTPAKSGTAKTTTKKMSTAAALKTSGRRHGPVKLPTTARSIKLTSAFLASAQLRPMAQQLAATRAPAAYAGVLSYAHSHPGEGAATAYLALAHANYMDHR